MTKCGTDPLTPDRESPANHAYYRSPLVEPMSYTGATYRNRNCSKSAVSPETTPTWMACRQCNRLERVFSKYFS